MERDKISNEKIQKAFFDSYGIITDAARKLRIHRKTLEGWCKAEPILEEYRQDGRGRLKDLTEGALIKNIKAGKEATIIFVSKTLNRDRGYMERMEIVDKNKATDALDDMSEDEILAHMVNTNRRLSDIASRPETKSE